LAANDASKKSHDTLAKTYFAPKRQGISLLGDNFRRKLARVTTGETAKQDLNDAIRSFKSIVGGVGASGRELNSVLTQLAAEDERIAA